MTQKQDILEQFLAEPRPESYWDLVTLLDKYNRLVERARRTILGKPIQGSALDQKTQELLDDHLRQEWGIPNPTFRDLEDTLTLEMCQQIRGFGAKCMTKLLEFIRDNDLDVDPGRFNPKRATRN